MKTTLRFGHMQWIHYASPTTEEVSQLVEQYEYHELIAEDLQETNVQPKIDQYDDVLFIVLNFPKYNVQTKKYVLNEFNIILWKDYIVTLSRYEASYVARIIEQYQQDLAESDTKDEEAFKISPYYILYTIIDVMYDKIIKAQTNSFKDVILLEAAMSSDDSAKAPIEDLMKKKSNATFIKYTFLPQKPILSEIQKACSWFYEWDLDVYFEDLDSKLDKIINNTHMLQDNIQSLTETNDALINNQMNKIMRVLTLLTAITWVLNLLMSFYSMNIKVPLMSYASAWWIILLIMWTLIVLMIYIFKRNKWM